MSDLLTNLAAAAGAAGGGLDVQEVFSTTLYTGNSGTQTITNGIDLDGEGGLVWIKCRNVGYTHFLNDTERGAGNVLQTNTTSANQPTTATFGVTSFNSDGFVVKDDGTGPGGALSGQGGGLNLTGNTYVSWTFRKAPKFFDIVTYTGNGAIRAISHNLGSVPGMIIIKRTDSTENWIVYHRGLDASSPQNFSIILNLTNARQGGEWSSTAPTSTEFTVGTDSSVNGSGRTFVVYLFAHDAGGFGADENVISCGSYTGNGSATGPTVTLGYEPQWLMIKRRNTTGDWIILDSKRNVSNPRDAYLRPNNAGAEETGNDVDFNATSFQLKTTSATVNASGSTYIYVSIRADM